MALVAVDRAQPRLGALLSHRIMRQTDVLVGDVPADDDVQAHGRGGLRVVAVEATGAAGDEDHGLLGFRVRWTGNTITFSGSGAAFALVFLAGFGASAASA